MKNDRKATIILLISYVAFGTTAVTKHFVTAPTGFVSMSRAFGGAISLFLVTLLLKRRISFSAIRKNAFILILSGISLAVNWVVLFTVYRLAGTAMATILDYLAPVIVFFLSPVLFKEKITVWKVLIALAAVLGVVMVSGAFSGAIMANGGGFMTGILLGIVCAITYALFIICNKKARDISPFDKGIAQMAVCGTVIIPYVLITEIPAVASYAWTPGNVALFLFFIFIQTGIAYGCYFYSIGAVPAQKSSILSFIDPVVTLSIAFLFLHESMDWIQAAGAVLILAGAFFLEFRFPKKQKAA